jgi:hypothetical protein
MSKWKTTREDYELEQSRYWDQQDRLLKEIKIEEYWDQQDQLLSESALALEEFRLEKRRYREEQDRLLEEYLVQQDQLFAEEREEFNREMDELELDSIKYSRLTCEYKPEEEVHDPRFDILCMDLDDPYFTPNPELEEYDAKLEQAYMRCEEADREEREEFDIDFIPEDDIAISVSNPSITVTSPSNESIIRAHAAEIVRKNRSFVRRLNPCHPDYDGWS